MSTDQTVRSARIQLKGNRTRASTILRDIDVMLDKDPHDKMLRRMREMVQDLYDAADLSLQALEDI